MKDHLQINVLLISIFYQEFISVLAMSQVKIQLRWSCDFSWKRPEFLTVGLPLQVPCVQSDLSPQTLYLVHGQHFLSSQVFRTVSELPSQSPSKYYASREPTTHFIKITGVDTCTLLPFPLSYLWIYSHIFTPTPLHSPALSPDSEEQVSGLGFKANPSPPTFLNSWLHLVSGTLVFLLYLPAPPLYWPFPFIP